MTRSDFNRIAVWGAGAWGSALANVAARAGRDVILWTRHEAAAAAIRERHDVRQLPGAKLDPRIAVTSDAAQAAQADAVLVAVPAQALRSVVRAFAPHVRDGTPLVACAKGIENKGIESAGLATDDAKFMTEVIAESAPRAAPAILSGPSFASDVMRGLPTAVTLAADDEALAEALAMALGSATFRPYHSADVRGVEIGGAAKNVLAIAAGIVAGRGLGASAAAALTTRGFAELFRFGEAYGARPQTLTGLSGLGDLILTCSSTQSRNFAHGVMLGEGREDDSGKLAEGVFTAPVLARMARARGIDMPISTAIAAVVAGHETIDAAIDSLLTRPFRAEA